MSRYIARGLALLGLVGAIAGGARADEVGDQLKSLLDKVGPSIVTVKLVLKTEMSMMGQSRDNEERTEVHGVVVDADGLVMINSTAISGDALSEMMGSEGDFSMKMTPSDIKVVIEREEKEYVAFLAATDSKVGLAFLKIEDLGDRKLAAVDFSAATDPIIGQTVAAVGRQRKAYDYAPYFETARVNGEIAKPRKAWMMDGSISGFGLPVFTQGGQVVGVLTTIQARLRDDDEGAGGGMGFGRIMRMLSGGGMGGSGGGFILPGSIVKATIGQAKAKAVEVAAERAKQKAEGKQDEGKKEEGKKDSGKEGEDLGDE